MNRKLAGQAIQWLLGHWQIVLTAILVLVSLGTLGLHKRVVLWPQKTAWKPSAYSDEGVGGKSKLLEFRNDGKTLLTRFILSDSKVRYAGVRLNFGPADTFDATGCNVLRLEYRTLTEDPLRVQILLSDLEFTRPGEDISMRFLYKELKPSLTWKRVDLSLSKFQTPGWWFKRNAIPPGLIPVPDFSRVIAISICEADLTSAGKPLGVELRSVAMDSPWWPTILTLSLLPLPYLLGLFLAPLENSMLRPFWQPQSVVSKGDGGFSRIVEFIAQNYADPDLSLAKIQKETGISESRISAVMEKRTGLRFKPYLNYVRIEEAARLLVETDLTVAEIATKVGYSNTAYFGRVFKATKQCVPGEYRRTSRHSKSD